MPIPFRSVAQKARQNSKLSTNVHDIAVIPNAMGTHLNPSAYGEVRTEKGPMNTNMVLGATRPITLPFADRIRPPKRSGTGSEYRFYVKAQPLRRKSGLKSVSFCNSAKHTRACLRPSATKAAVVLIPHALNAR